MEAIDPSGIEQILQYEFNDKNLLQEALRHSSFVNELGEPQLRDNERLEFLGDAVLNLIVGHILMRCYPDLKEGDLSRSRANLVNESQLAKMARSFNLGLYIQLGKGEIQTHGRDKNSILADTFEALMAAIYLDGGFDAAFQIIETNFQPLIEYLHSTANNHDYKSQLQEKVQIEHGSMPDYSIVREDGPDHDKTFWVALKVLNIETQGSGKSKKTAEQDAARLALEILNKES
ncbi:Ribonuclease III (EC [Olavius sp. associated proteobacterium Delta 1]|nr:Ribonuclease III (EC [Olavius sp. associated proteobacterium Delta 1]